MASRLKFNFPLSYNQLPRNGANIDLNVNDSWTMRFYLMGDCSRFNKPCIQLIRDRSNEFVFLRGLIYIFYEQHNMTKKLACEFLASCMEVNQKTIYIRFNESFREHVVHNTSIDIEIKGTILTGSEPLETNPAHFENLLLYNPIGGDMFNGNLCFSQMYEQANCYLAPIITDDLGNSDRNIPKKPGNSVILTTNNEDSQKKVQANGVAKLLSGMVQQSTIITDSEVKHTSRKHLESKDKDQYLMHGQIVEQSTKCCNYQKGVSKPCTLLNKESESAIMKDLENLSKDNLTMLETGKYSDLMLVCGEKTFNVHRSILASRCSVFEQKIENLEENKLHITDVGSDAIYVILIYLYGGVIKEMTTSLAIRLLKSSKAYKLDVLHNFCKTYLTRVLQMENAIDILLAAEGNSEILRDTAMKYIVEKFDSLEPTEQWKLFKQSGNKLVIEILTQTIAKMRPS